MVSTSVKSLCIFISWFAETGLKADFDGVDVYLSGWEKSLVVCCGECICEPEVSNVIEAGDQRECGVMKNARNFGAGLYRRWARKHPSNPYFRSGLPVVRIQIGMGY